MTHSTFKLKHVRRIKSTLLILVFSIATVSAQDVKWGIGISTNVHLFYHSNNKLYANSVFHPVASRTYGIVFKREFTSKGHFKSQVNLNWLGKTVALSSSQNNTKQSFTYNFFSADLGVNVLYDNPETPFNLRPFVGLSLASSYFISATNRQSSSTSNTSRGFNIEAKTPEDSHKWYFYPCFNLGVSRLFQLRKEGHFWELALSAQLSPVTSFSTLQVPSPTNNLQLLAGNLHGISLSVNRFF
jgi:hypothetical protein